MIVDKLEDTLNGGYGGLYGEVVTEDTYKLKQLKFVPDVIFDLGANVGVFSRFARELFPDARIFAVEPDPENYEHLMKFSIGYNIDVLNRAIGIGSIYRCFGAANGAHESYISRGFGFNTTEMRTIVKTDIATIMPDELIKMFSLPGEKTMLKCDIEGNENMIWGHKPSMDALKTIDYICMELHFYASGEDMAEEVRAKTLEALAEFEETHDCVLDHIYFYATKKG